MFNEEDLPDSDFEQALMLKDMVVAHATNGSVSEFEYKKIRENFMGNSDLKHKLPPFIRTCRDGDSLWAHLRSVASGNGSYAIRSSYVVKAFEPLLELLEEGASIPSDDSVSAVLAKYDAEGVQAAWKKAVKRRETDPQGAITSARTLLEEVCKHILEDVGHEGFERWDLPKLYSETAKCLNLAPSQHTEDVFKKILGGCHTVVESLGSLRNKISDAHAQGRKPVKPLARHAALAVNLSGSMSMFLIETWLEKRSGCD